MTDVRVVPVDVELRPHGYERAALYREVAGFLFDALSQREIRSCPAA